MDTAVPTVINPQQLNRIESVHRGFLYQHVYATACLLSMSEVGTVSATLTNQTTPRMILPAALAGSNSSHEEGEGVLSSSRRRRIMARPCEVVRSCGSV